MSILSDAEIIDLCVCPKTKIVTPQDPNYHTPVGSGGATISTLMGWVPTPYEVELTDEEKQAFRPMIEPFVNGQVKSVKGSSTKPMSDGKGGMCMVTIPTGEEKRIVSYGLSSYGYDLRIGRHFKIFTNINSTVIDPKAFDEKNFVEFEGDVCIIPPNSFVLAYSLEYMRIPRDVNAIVLGKSTYARCGISCLATPLEAGWEGHVTLEFANTTPLPAKLYAGEGGCQVNFFQGSRPCLVSYADRAGKYMHQAAQPVAPRV